MSDTITVLTLLWLTVLFCSLAHLLVVSSGILYPEPVENTKTLNQQYMILQSAKVLS